MNTEQKTYNLAAKKLSANISEKEQNELNDILESNPEMQNIYKELEQIWGFETNQEDFNIENAFDSISEKINITEKKTLKLSPTLWKAAAVILIIMSSTVGYYLFFGNNEQMLTAETNISETTETILSDGTVVTLNENSKFRYPEEFKGKTRTVKLDGEAYFDVKPGKKKFIILTDGGKITVHGTKFNLEAYKNEQKIRVDLHEGKVEFTSVNNKQKKILFDNQAITFDKITKTIKSNTVYNRNSSSWKSNRLEFDRTPLKIVAEDLSELYKIKIVTDSAAANILISGAYHNKKPEQIITAISLTQGITADTTKNIIYIRAN